MTQPGFIPFPKIAQLNRDIVITEKIDDEKPKGQAE